MKNIKEQKEKKIISRAENPLNNGFNNLLEEMISGESSKKLDEEQANKLFSVVPDISSEDEIEIDSNSKKKKELKIDEKTIDINFQMWLKSVRERESLVKENRQSWFVDKKIADIFNHLRSSTGIPASQFTNAILTDWIKDNSETIEEIINTRRTINL